MLGPVGMRYMATVSFHNDQRKSRKKSSITLIDLNYKTSPGINIPKQAKMVKFLTPTAIFSKYEELTRRAAQNNGLARGTVVY